MVFCEIRIAGVYVGFPERSIAFDEMDVGKTNDKNYYLSRWSERIEMDVANNDKNYSAWQVARSDSTFVIAQVGCRKLNRVFLYPSRW